MHDPTHVSILIAVALTFRLNTNVCSRFDVALITCQSSVRPQNASLVEKSAITWKIDLWHVGDLIALRKSMTAAPTIACQLRIEWVEAFVLGCGYSSGCR